MPKNSAATIIATFVDAAARSLAGRLPPSLPAQQVRRVVDAAATELQQREAGADFYVASGLRDALQLRNAELLALWVAEAAPWPSKPRSPARIRELSRHFDLTERQVRNLVKPPAPAERPQTPRRRADLGARLVECTLAHATSEWPGVAADDLAAALQEAAWTLRRAHAGRRVYMSARRARRNQARDAIMRTAWAEPGPGGVGARTQDRLQQLAQQHGLSMRRVREIVAASRKGGAL